MRFKIELSYCGNDFCGWQIQPDAPSVQEALQHALSVLTGNDVQVTGAGRTDTGVNATRYVAHFDLPEAHADGKVCDTLCCKLNAILPHSISIHKISPAEDGFHARFDAKSREYTYYVHRVKDPFAERFSYLFSYPEFNVEAMNKAAAHLLGEHNFSCFEKAGSDNDTSICTVTKAVWEPYLPEVRCGGEGEYWKFTIRADRFLRNMVRAVVGTLLEVGRGRRSIEEFSSLILPPDRNGKAEKKGANRSRAGESVPGNALFLSETEY